MVNVKQFPGWIVKLYNLYRKPLGNSNALNPHTCHMVPDTRFMHIHMHMQMHVSVTFY